MLLIILSLIIVILLFNKNNNHIQTEWCFWYKPLDAVINSLDPENTHDSNIVQQIKTKHDHLLKLQLQPVTGLDQIIPNQLKPLIRKNYLIDCLQSGEYQVLNLIWRKIHDNPGQIQILKEQMHNCYELCTQGRVFRYFECFTHVDPDPVLNKPLFDVNQIKQDIFLYAYQWLQTNHTEVFTEQLQPEQISKIKSKLKYSILKRYYWLNNNWLNTIIKQTIAGLDYE